VRVLTVVDARLATSTGLMMTGMPGGPVADLNDAADGHVNAAAARLREAGLSAMGFVRDGDPKRVIVDEAERAAVDCIFLGARGHTRLERFLLGSVSSAVASRAPCSVEVIRGH
jgi:nucleotide-binding universal stress UspA family protein